MLRGKGVEGRNLKDAINSRFFRFFSSIKRVFRFLLANLLSKNNLQYLTSERHIQVKDSSHNPNDKTRFVNMTCVRKILLCVNNKSLYSL